MRDAARRARLEASLERYLALLFVGRVLLVTQAIAMIAATALQYDLTLVTRNGKDFADLGADLLNPWAGPITSAPAARKHGEAAQPQFLAVN